MDLLFRFQEDSFSLIIKANKQLSYSCSSSTVMTIKEKESLNMCWVPSSVLNTLNVMLHLIFKHWYFPLLTEKGAEKQGIEVIFSSHRLISGDTFLTMALSPCVTLSPAGWLSSVQFSSVAQSCPTLCDPMNHSTPGLPVHHQLLEFTQTHVHWVSDAIQPSHPLSSPSPAPNPSQHQGLFQWVNSSHEVAKVLKFQL